MVFLSISPMPSHIELITHSISRSPPPSLHYSPSIYSSKSHHSSSTSKRQNKNYSSYTYQQRNESTECLLGPSNKRVRYENQRVQVLRQRERSRNYNTRMAENGNEERRMSYGIGGAGNIRRPSEVIYPPRMNPDGTRRKSSVWSTITPSPGSSPDSKRAAIFSFFKKSGGTTEVPGRSLEENGVVFNEVDLGGKKKVEVE